MKTVAQSATTYLPGPRMSFESSLPADSSAATSVHKLEQINESPLTFRSVSRRSHSVTSHSRIKATALSCV